MEMPLRGVVNWSAQGPPNDFIGGPLHANLSSRQRHVVRGSPEVELIFREDCETGRRVTDTSTSS